MERLTYSSEKGIEIKGAEGAPCDEVCENRMLSGCHDCPIQTAFDRLAAYEDTGLTPEEIVGLCSMDRRANMAELLRMEENPPLTLEQLREMGKDWVWIKLLVPQYRMDTGYYIKHEEDPGRDSFQCGYPRIWVRGLPYSLYGDTWIAYRHRPEEETK